MAVQPWDAMWQLQEMPYSEEELHVKMCAEFGCLYAQICERRLPFQVVLQEQPAQDGQSVGGEGVPQPGTHAAGRYSQPTAHPPAHACPRHGVCGLRRQCCPTPEGLLTPGHCVGVYAAFCSLSKCP